MTRCALPLPRLARLSLIAVFVAGTGACFAENVSVDAQGFESLPLKGKRNVEGTLTHDIVYKNTTQKAGARFRIEDTWIKRTKAGAKGGYVIGGYYDPALASTKGFVLPTGATEIFYVGRLLPDRVLRIPVPQRHFKPDGQE